MFSDIAQSRIVDTVTAGTINDEYIMPPRDNGQLWQQIGKLQADMKTLQSNYREIDKKLDVLVERSANDRGRRGTRWNIFTTSFSLASLAIAFASWWNGSGGK